MAMALPRMGRLLVVAEVEEDLGMVAAPAGVFLVRFPSLSHIQMWWSD
jgi:hypothetical protein